MGQLVRLTPTGKILDQWTWRAHQHTVTSVTQHEGQIWTGDSWANVRCWSAPDSWAALPPRLQVEIQIRRHVVDLLPYGLHGVVIATDAGLVRIDLSAG